MKNLCTLLVLFLSLSTAPAQAQKSCELVHTPAQQLRFPESLVHIQGKLVIGSHEIQGRLDDITSHAEIKAYLESHKSSTRSILGRIQLPDEMGGGSLRLISLDLGDHNRNYNHQELVALLKVNPALAHKLGFFAVEGYENFAWVPDVDQINKRLSLVAREQGIAKAMWSYGSVDGVVAFGPYSKLLSEGKFPFSREGDVNLTVHDAMHSVSFAALNSIGSTRKIMQAALHRNEAVYNIYQRLKKDLPMLASAFEGQAAALSADAMERTMLLTIQMTGNFGYFSPSEPRTQGKYFTPQNQDITQKRIANLLRLYAEGNTNFKTVFTALSYSIQHKPEEVEKLKTIFREEMKALVSITLDEYQQAAQALAHHAGFFATSMFSTSPDVQQLQSMKGIEFGNYVNVHFIPEEAI